MLDSTERKLVDALTREPRATHRSLARELDVSESVVANRIRKLVDDSAIASTIMFDWRAAGYTRSMYFWLRCSGRPIEDVAAEIAELPFARNISSVIGDANLFVHLLLPEGDHALVAARTSIGQVDGVSVVRQDLVLDHFAHSISVQALPIDEPAVPELPNPVVSLDELDVQLCEQLAADARQSNRAIARKLGTTEATLRARLKRLEGSGLVRIVTVVDPRQMATQSAGAFIAIGGIADPRSTAGQLAGLPYVSSATTTAGGFDLHLIVTASSTAELTSRLIADLPAEPGLRTDIHLLGEPLVFSARLRRLLDR